MRTGTITSSPTFIKKQSIDEMKHAEALIERILFLEGTPNLTKPMKLSIGRNGQATTGGGYEARGGRGRDVQRASAQAAREAGDNVSRELFERLLKDEEQSARVFRETSFARAPSAKLKNQRIHSCPVVCHACCPCVVRAACGSGRAKASAIPSRAPTSELNEELVKSSFESVLLCLLLAGASGWAQDSESKTPAPAPTPSAPRSRLPRRRPPRRRLPRLPQPPPRRGRQKFLPPINTGNGFSIEPIYWLRRGTPVFAPVRWRRGPTLNTRPRQSELPQQTSQRQSGARVSIPVSKNGTLRGSYFQTEQSYRIHHGSRNLNLFGQAITGGDLWRRSYRIEGFKFSYDYLTYFWKRGNSEMRLKTLYEIQRISVSNEVDDFQVDSTGALVNINPATGYADRSSSRRSDWGWSTLCRAISAGKREPRVSRCRTSGAGRCWKRKLRFA